MSASEDVDGDASSTSTSNSKGSSPQVVQATEEQPLSEAATSTSPREEIQVKLYKSRRFKGYLTIFLASLINVNAAVLSDAPIFSTTVPASPTQKRYAQTVGIISCIITACMVVCHLDRYSPMQKVWAVLFSATGRVETGIIVFLCLWWAVATVVQTTARGIAGDGKVGFIYSLGSLLSEYKSQ